MPKLIQALLTGHHPTVFHPHAAVLVPAVIAAVSDTFYKISSEALVVLQLLVKVLLSQIAGLVSNHLSSQVLRPLDSSPTTFDFTLYTANIYSCCFVRLKAQDIDQEVIYIKPYPTSLQSKLAGEGESNLVHGSGGGSPGRLFAG